MKADHLSGRRCFDLRSILTFAPAGIGWAMADACEAVAGRPLVDPDCTDTSNMKTAQEPELENVLRVVGVVGCSVNRNSERSRSAHAMRSTPKTGGRPHLTDPLNWD